MRACGRSAKRVETALEVGHSAVSIVRAESIGAVRPISFDWCGNLRGAPEALGFAGARPPLHLEYHAVIRRDDTCFGRLNDPRFPSADDCAAASEP